MREAKRLMRALGEVNERYIDEATPGRSNRENVSWERFAAIAAALILMLSLSVAAYAANWFGLRDVLLPLIQPSFFTKQEENNRIGLSGYQESAEGKALAEWYRFVQEYDTDRTILKQLEQDPAEEGHESWTIYGVYTEEMAQKLEEIAKKYGLKLHTKCDVIDQEELMRRVGGCFMDKDALTWAYMYEDGYFHVEGDINLAETGTANFQLVRSIKGTLNSVVLRIGEVEAYTEHPYIAACGEQVLLAIGPNKSLILANFKDCFVSVNVLCGREQGMTEELLQEMADRIDFTILKKVQLPEMKGDSEVSIAQELAILELMYGKVGNLGVGTLAYTVPYDDRQDYKLCFFAGDTREEWSIADADYVFPDARVGNVPISRLQTMECCEVTDVDSDGIADVLAVACYDGEGRPHYDTRVYLGGKDGYVLDGELTRKLNEKYGDEKAYPVWDVLEQIRAEKESKEAGNTGGKPAEKPTPEGPAEPTAEQKARQRAYLDIICHLPDNLAPHYEPDGIDFRSKKELYNPLDNQVYLGLHDFDGDGIEELIAGDALALAVFTYQNDQAVKIADLCDSDSAWCINGVYFKDNSISLNCDGSGGSDFVNFGYVDGEYMLGIYRGTSSSAVTINGAVGTPEEMNAIYTLDWRLRSLEERIAPIRLVWEQEKWVLKYLSGDEVVLDENFDFERIRW